METIHQQNDIIAQRYRIVNPLGRGQSSTTYEAEDVTNNRRVALKVLSLRQVTDWKVLELFEREAKILANLDHPGIPKYLNHFHSDRSNDRRFYLVEELVSGESLAELVQKGWHPSEKEVQGIAIQVLEIINYLHSLIPSVIHRDIKPQNLIRTSKGKIYLVDFGAVQDVYRNTLTRGGTFVGTLGYMPLEQFSGSVVPGSDLYSLGATLLFLLTGRSPEDLPQRRMKIDFRSRVEIKAQFADGLEKMLAPAHEDRFQSANEAKELLRDRTSTDKNTEKGTVDLKYPQPDNSDIFIHKTDQGVAVKLSYYNAQRVLMDLMLFMSGAIGLAGGLFMLLIRLRMGVYRTPGVRRYRVRVGGGLGSEVFSELIKAVFLALVILLSIVIAITILRFLFTLINQIWGRIEIEIGRDKFTVRRKLGEKVYYKYQGKTADMERIETVNKSYKIFEFEREISKCVIWEGVHKHSFKISSREECEWLVAELSYSISQVRSPDAV